jgi:hypothetical protein
MMFEMESIPPMPEREKILSAKDALELTKQTHLNRIQRFIEVAIEAGKCECEILPNVQFVSEENKQILRDAGYKVIEKESMLGKEILINWENA